ncbi:MAG: hypothetical protein R2744_11440 [Bacteroidales bacterium]
MAVIQSESELARDGNVEGLKSLYQQDGLNTRININANSYSILTGWDKVGANFDKYAANAGTDLNSATITKENPIIKVNEESAWVLCDNTWEGVYQGENFVMNNLQLTFLEKVEGEWKISLVAWLDKQETPEELPEEE